METLEAVQISDSTIVFTQDALEDAIEQGIADPEYLNQIRRQMAAEAVQESLEHARDAVLGFIGGVATNIKLEARAAVYDTLHGTHYRQIRHQLIAERRQERKEARNRRFAESIGLTAIK